MSKAVVVKQTPQVNPDRKRQTFSKEFKLEAVRLLERGEIGRFDDVGCFASYARCVDSARMSNGKKKGEGNRKNGNKYLSWAFV
ncbi:MAG: hypothetical protein ACK5VR_08625, partial [Burkholderiales bacterium]